MNEQRLWKILVLHRDFGWTAFDYQAGRKAARAQVANFKRFWSGRRFRIVADSPAAAA